MRKVIISVVILANLLSCKGVGKEEVVKPNVIFILADDLGYADLSCMGSEYYETPNIDGIANRGIRFSNGYAACQVCSPSRVSIQTGKYAARHGVTTWIGDPSGEAWRGMENQSKMLPAEYKHSFSQDEFTWAEAMKKNGYKTFFAGKWHAGDTGSLPEDHGYDINVGGWEIGFPKGGYYDPFDNPKMQNRKPGENLSLRLARETVDFIKENKDQPFFVCLSFYAVHAPVQTTKEKWAKYREKALAMGVEEEGFVADAYLPRRKKQDNPVYAGLVETMDDAVGIVMDGLKDLDLDKNTIVIFTSDNGGVCSGDEYATSNRPLKGGKGQAYEGGIRVPYIVSVPWLADSFGTCNDTPVNAVDFYPTILDLIKSPYELNASIDGVSIKNVLLGKPLAERAMYWHYPHYGNQGGEPSSMIRKGNYKLIYFWEDNHTELYNLAVDIAEENDLSKQEPQKEQELRTNLLDWLVSVNAKYPTNDPQYNAEKSKEMVAKRMKERKAKLEAKRASMYQEDFQPNADWWGSETND